MKNNDGIIIKSSGGFYYVELSDGTIIECRAKGKFRKLNLSPLVGDNVSVEYGTDLKGTVVSINDRINSFIRPPVANIDRFIIISSVVSPEPNLYIIDKLTALSYFHDVKPLVIFTKCDLDESDRYTEIYNRSGIESFGVSVMSCMNLDRFRDIISSGFSVLTGNTGVGKSSLLNACDPSLNLATGEISDALGRGRHTTRTVEMFRVSGGRVMDTPGFSSLDGRDGEIIRKEQLAYCFPEFEAYTDDCRFPDCSHLNDKGCAVREAVSKTLIPISRYESYKQMYEDVKDLPDWK